MKFGFKTTFQCPHCLVHSQHHLLSPDMQGFGAWTFQVAKGTIFGHKIYRCSNCDKDTYFLANLHANSPDDDVLHQFPVASPVLHIAVPESVRTSATEAEKCLSVGAYNACGTMARRAVDAMCIDLGAIGKVLYDRLEDLKKKHVITPTLWDIGEELRTAGKVGAHPDWEEMDAQDAAYAVNFLQELIRHVYIHPYEIQQRNLKTSKKKKP